MRSTERRHLSRIANVRSKKPREEVRLLERRLMTRMRFFTVTAVGRFARLVWVPLMPDFWERNAGGVGRRGGVMSVEAGAFVESGRIVVPVPLGFVTFLIRIGMLSRITCSIVNGCITSEP